MNSPSIPEKTAFWGKAAAAAVSLVTIVLVLAPISENWRRVPRDDFPLSYYPMFTKGRWEPMRVTFIVGVDGQGRQVRIPYNYAGRGGLNQVRKQICKRVEDGNANELCQSVARRLVRDKSGDFADIDAVYIVTGTFLADDFFRGNKTPDALRVEASCSVRPDKT